MIFDVKQLLHDKLTDAESHCCVGAAAVTHMDKDITSKSLCTETKSGNTVLISCDSLHLISPFTD